MRVFIITILIGMFLGNNIKDSVAQSLVLNPNKDLIPHKALYEIKMVSKKSGAQILNISGQMFYEWRPECEAWATNHHFNLLYEYADSSPMQITSDFSTYETYDGKSFDFTSRRNRNGELYQEIRGHAGEQAIYSIPDDLVFNLKAGTLFPMAHSLGILEKAKNGEKFYNAILFDGSDEEGPVEVNTFIGDSISAPDPGTIPYAIDKALLQGKAWKVRMAFFPLQADSSEYEMDIIFHKNGIISDMMIEYKDFSITQKLTALKKLEAVSCIQSNNKSTLK